MLDAWITIQRSHAIANGVFVAVTNRVGVEDDLEFWGNSFVADPFGEIIAQADAKSEDTLIVECDLGKIERTRRNCFLRDRRIDSRLSTHRSVMYKTRCLSCCALRPLKVTCSTSGTNFRFLPSLAIRNWLFSTRRSRPPAVKYPQKKIARAEAVMSTNPPQPAVTCGRRANRETLTFPY